MPKLKQHISTSTFIIATATIAFLLIIGIVFFITFKLGQKTGSTPTQQLIETSRDGGAEDQQIKRIRFIKQSTGEIMEIMMDGTVKYYDKNGKLIKTGRRGFAETQQILRKFEWLINNGKTIEGGDYRIEIETEEGTIIVNPGGGGTGGGDIDDAIDFIDRTINPTPTPRPSPTPSTGLPTPNPSITPSPSPILEYPDYLTAPPFTCEDYYKGGKPLKISNIICGPSPTP